jgi:uncharacterized membrane protein
MMKKCLIYFSKLRPGKAAILVAAFILIYIATFCTLALIKYYSYQTYAYDLGIFNQAMWNTLHGRFMECTIIGHNYFGDHFTPVLLFLLPFYALFQSAATLLVLQTVLLAIGAVPVYWLARDKLGKEAGVIFAAVYLLFPSLQTLNIFEFHPIALVTTPLLFAFYYLDKGNYKAGLIFCVLAMLCQEEVCLIVLALGIYLAITKRKWALSAGMIGAGVAWFILTFLIIIPHIRGGPYGYYDRYGYLGHSFIGIITTALTHPGLVLDHVFIKDKLRYLAGILGPVGFISLFSLSIIIALPPLAQNTISDYSYQYSLFFQYNATIIPFVMVAAILGTARLASSERMQRLWRKVGVKRLLLGYTVVAALVSNIMISPSPISLSFYSKSWDNGPITPYYRSSYVIDSHDHTISRLKTLIPAKASLSAAPHIVPSLAKREVIYAYSFASDSVDYVIIDTKDRTWAQFLNDYQKYTQQLLANPNYGVIAAEDGVVVFQRGSTNKDILPYQKLTLADPQYKTEVTFADQPVKLLGYDFKWMAEESGANVALISLYWQSSQRIGQDLRIRSELDSYNNSFIEEHWLGWNIYPTGQWKQNEIVKESYKMKLPAHLSMGDYKLQLKLSSYWDALIPTNVPNNEGLFVLGTFNYP